MVISLYTKFAQCLASILRASLHTGPRPENTDYLFRLPVCQAVSHFQSFSLSFLSSVVLQCTIHTGIYINLLSRLATESY